VLLVPRPCGSAAGRPPVDARADGFVNIFHFGPCHERAAAEGGREVVVTAMVTDAYTFGGEMGFDADSSDFDPIGWSGGAANPEPRLDEFVISLESGTMTRRERLPVMCPRPEGGAPIDVPFDMPTIHPLLDGRETRYVYAAGAARIEGWFPFNSIVKVDLKQRPVGAHAWFAPEHAMVSEPMLLPRGEGGVRWLGPESEDDGFVVSVVHDSETARCEAYIWDARRFADGPFAALDLGELYPWDVHANYLPGVCLDG
jgi:carotenoid cleavage dioxygenase-like enzyme